MSLLQIQFFFIDLYWKGTKNNNFIASFSFSSSSSHFIRFLVVCSLLDTSIVLFYKVVVTAFEIDNCFKLFKFRSGFDLPQFLQKNFASLQSFLLYSC